MRNRKAPPAPGITLTHLSGKAARCSRDMVVKRNIDAVAMQIRREIAEACSKATGKATSRSILTIDLAPRRLVVRRDVIAVEQGRR